MLPLLLLLLRPLLPSLLTLSTLTFLSHPTPTVSAPPPPDLLIIGAGTSGCVLASRLCLALPNTTLLLLERAPPRTPSQNLFVRQPRNTVPSWTSPATSEIFPSLPDPALFNRSSTIVTGNTLGGSSAINALQWAVPPAHSIRRWNLRGLTPSVARRLYRNAFAHLRFSPQHPRLRSALESPYLNAANRAGFATHFDPFHNDPAALRVWPQAVAVSRAGRRRDSCSAYLTPRVRAQCPNLTIKQGVTVTALLFKSHSASDTTSRLDPPPAPRVYAVKYVASNDKLARREHLVTVRNEVLLSAGPFGSPKLLLLSGVGPAQQLRRHQVPVVKDLAVGTRTQARGYNGVVSVYSGAPLDPTNNSSVVDSRHANSEWLSGSPSVLSSTGFMTLGTVKRSAYCMSASALGRHELDIPAIYSFCVGNPTAHGWLRLRDRNPFSSPLVRLNLLAKRRDMRRMQTCMRRMLRLHNQLPHWMQAKVVSPPQSVSADDERFLRASTHHAYHFVGGCAVGKVVHGNLKVRGVEGLRVIDSSVLNRMPESAGPLASTYMIAEYAAERLAGVYGRGEKW